MKALEIKQTINGVNEEYLIKTQYINTNLYIIQNITKGLEYLNELKRLKIYDNDINEIIDEIKKNNPKFNDKIDYKKESAYVLISSIDQFYKKLEGSSQIVDVLIPKSKENSLSIKLKNTNELNEIIKNLSTIETYINQVITNDKINGKLEINNWENGSFWIDLCLGTTYAVSLIGSITWSAIVLLKKYQEAKIFEEHVKGLTIKNESLNDLLDAQKESIKILIDAEAKHIYQENIENEIDYDYLERLKSTIKIFAELIDNGTEIHPNLMTPEESKNLFPNFKAIETVQSKIKQIEDKS